jgi:hypothetical protein
MRVRKIYTLAVGLALALAACSQAPTPVAQQFVLRDGVAMVDSHLGGDRTAWIRLQPADRQVLSQHRWVAGDVVEYHLSLQSSTDGVHFAPVAPAVNLVLPTKGGLVPNGAQLTGLVAGNVYRVSLEAWGNAGGQLNTTNVLMNSKTASFADFDFRPNADNNVQTAYSTSMQVVLDPLVISGSVDVAVSPPADASVVCEPGATDPACPTPTPTPTPLPNGLYFVDASTDMVGVSTNGPDGTGEDGHFRLSFDAPADNVTYRIHLAGGLQADSYGGAGFLGVYQNGTILNSTYAAPLSTSSGHLVFDLYVPLSGSQGWYSPGTTFTAQIIDQLGNPLASFSTTI